MAGTSDRLRNAASTVSTLLSSGIVGLERPDKTVKLVSALSKFGPSAAAAMEMAAIRKPDTIAVIDDDGIHTWGDLGARTSALARALHARGIKAGSAVGTMLRDQADFPVSVAAVSRVGADLILLNTSFAAPQISGVVEREGVELIICDAEFEGLMADAGIDVPIILAGSQTDSTGTDSVSDVVRTAPSAEPPVPESPGRTVILTSGTTGTPKGARRGKQPGLSEMAALLEKIPYRSGETTVVSAPLFHSWGFANMTIQIALGNTMVLRRKFSPAQSVEDINRYDASGLVVVPVMLKRMLELPESQRTVARGTLRIIALSGSAFPAELALAASAEYGDVCHNLYGSTEVAWATIATPDDIKAAPGCAGRPPRGVAVTLVDEGGNEVPRGERGRIFVGNEMLFEGYTGGGGKEVLEGMMSTGDVGYFDEGGRLFVEGRDDDMIVSGGENVFPEEVEDCLNTHPAVLEAAVVGVPDEEFGQRLRAAVTLNPGAKADADELSAHVKGQLARYKVPREILFLDELPRNATGKIVRRQVAEL
jgi:fatty-acyl-CoA synthase